ncbi:MAG TPA: TIGR03936 family radical SAM-associated protein [Thermoclostridium caenicola]|uniref:TIGR03936 family radical SAM-associated protein n=1 Tax=Thermoclostridium caenicola TaxID=659425 RepID=UPI002CB790AC|nr:TIGR03936 family radical SAM-associated protein [Thermoclostridium caenicola]HOL84740.1 TIGR03936 family radical SAM-associated protein [Thermoclostridium caenicola]HPO75791.1 TIGR03936 family radical SAM-associated protein [Thermoclostridium caenicola]
MARALRFRFSRDERLKYIAHLDVLRLFERAIKRAGLPVAYTQGFNPRQKIVFGLPIAVGLTSSAEYADIEFDEEMTPESFISRINQSLPEGIEVMEAVPVRNMGRIMSLIASARYEIAFTIPQAMDQDTLSGIVIDFLDQEDITAMKKTKKGMRPVNIRPLIYSLSVRKPDGDGYIMEAFLSAGAENNLRPDLLMQAFAQKTGLELTVESIHRRAMFASDFNEWKSPLEVADD